jgi:glutathione S-transferase
MASQLQESAFLTGAEPTLADIANYSYVALAPQGGLSLDDFPALGAWLARLEAMPRFLPITRT